MTTAEKIEIMQHHEYGGETEMENKGAGDWGGVLDPGWDWVAFSYRKKPQEKLYEWVLKLSTIEDHIISDTLRTETKMRNEAARSNILSYQKTGRWYNPVTREFGNDAT